MGSQTNQIKITIHIDNMTMVKWWMQLHINTGLDGQILYNGTHGLTLVEIINLTIKDFLWRMLNPQNLKLILAEMLFEVSFQFWKSLPQNNYCIFFTISLLEVMKNVKIILSFQDLHKTI